MEREIAIIWEKKYNQFDFLSSQYVIRYALLKLIEVNWCYDSRFNENSQGDNVNWYLKSKWKYHGKNGSFDVESCWKPKFQWYDAVI